MKKYLLALSLCLLTSPALASGFFGGGGSTGPTSVSNSDGTLTISPTTGAVVASLALGHSNVWTIKQAISANTHALPTAQTGTLLQLGNADSTSTRYEADAFGSTGYFTAVREDGTAASPTTLQAGDEIGGFNAWGYNGTAIVGPNASLRTYANQNWGVGSNGTYVDIATTPNGSTTLTQVARFENNGGITVPNTVTGGSEGAGTINAGGLYVNGTSAGTVISTTFTGDGTVLSSTPSSAVTRSGTLTATLNTQSAHAVLAGPTSSTATPTFRSLVGSDLPNPSASTLGGIESYAAVSNQWINTISTSGVPSSTQPAFSNISGTFANSQVPNPLGINTTSGFGTIQVFGVNPNLTADNAAVSQINSGAVGQKSLVLQAYSSSQTANLLELQNSSGTGYLTFGPPILSGYQNYWIYLSATQPSSTSSAQYGQYMSLTTAGSDSQIRGGEDILLNSGYSGSSNTIGLNVFNNVIGTGAQVTAAKGNSGIVSYSQSPSNGSGYSYGVVGNAAEGHVSVGNLGISNFGNNNIGIGSAGFAYNSGTMVGGYFALIANSASDPTFTSAALIADNGPESAPVFLGRVNGTTNFQIDAKGHIVASGGTSPTVVAQSGLGTTGSASISGTDERGTLTVTPGGLTIATGAQAIVTFGNAFSVAPKIVILTPANSAAALLTGVTMVFVDTFTTTTWTLESGTTALTTSTAYTWYYFVIG